MARPTLVRWFVVIVVAISISVLWLKGSSHTGAAKAAQQPSPTTSDPRFDMVKVLQAMGPHPSLGDQANVFGRFVGTWDVDYTFFTKDGKTSHAKGEVIAGWVMDGHAIQDLFISYPTAQEKERHMGTTVRYFDPKSGQWRITFVLPEFDYVRTLSGGAVGNDRIVLRGQDPDGTELRWSFNDIRADTFVWRGEKSEDHGKTWWMEEEHHFKRRR